MPIYAVVSENLDLMDAQTKNEKSLIAIRDLYGRRYTMMQVIDLTAFVEGIFGAALAQAIEEEKAENDV